MGIKIGNKDVSKIYLGNKEVKEVYLGNKLIYTAVQMVEHWQMRSNFQMVKGDVFGSEFHMISLKDGSAMLVTYTEDDIKRWEYMRFIPTYNKDAWNKGEYRVIFGVDVNRGEILTYWTNRYDYVKSISKYKLRNVEEYSGQTLNEIDDFGTMYILK